MATLKSTFHMSPARPDPAMPIFIPASDLPDVTVSSHGFYVICGITTSNPDAAHRLALECLAAERALRKREADKEAERLRAEASRVADAAKLDKEAAQLRGALTCGELGMWADLNETSKEDYRRVALKAREIHLTGPEAERTRHE